MTHQVGSGSVMTCLVGSGSEKNSFGPATLLGVQYIISLISLEPILLVLQHVLLIQKPILIVMQNTLLVLQPVSFVR